MSTSQRLRRAIEHRFRSIRAFSEHVGIPYRTLQQYLAGIRAPGAEALSRIASQTDIDLNWLLTGEGELVRGGREPGGSLGGGGEGSGDSSRMEPSAGLRAQSVREADESETEQLIQELNLGRIAVLGRRGGQAGAWQILAILETRFPRALSVEDIVTHLEQDGASPSEEDVATDLTLLIHFGLVVEEGRQVVQYRAAGRDGRLRSTDMMDVNQHALEAIRLLARTILPATENSRGKIMSARLSVKKGHAEAAMLAIREAVRAAVDEHMADDGEEEVAVVVGLGVVQAEKD